MEFIIKDNRTVTVRQATPDDAEKLLKTAMANILEQEFILTAPEEFKFTVEQEREWIKSMTANPANLLLIAEADGETAGILNVTGNPRKKLSHTAEFGMGVLKDYRNMGIGAMLIREMIAWAEKNERLEKLTLQVFANNEKAIHLYKKFGFREEGRLPKAIKNLNGEYIDNVMMYRML